MPVLDDYSLPVLSPAVEAVTLSEIKNEVRQDSSADDTPIADIRDAVIWRIEQEIGKSLIHRTLIMRFDAAELSAKLDLWMGPVASITSIIATLRDDTNTTVTASNYFLTSDRVGLKTYNGATWPTTLRPLAGLAVTYISGFGTTQASIPNNIRMAVRKLAASMYDEPDEDLTSAALPVDVARLLAPFIRYRI